MLACGIFFKKEGGTTRNKVTKMWHAACVLDFERKKTQLSNLKFVNTSVPRIKGRNKKLDKLPWMTTILP